ncbi:MAG: hypothetical protein WC829_03100 [Hyphomicrobium sp.]
MKLNVEEIAKEAGWGNVVSMPHINALEAFTRLIVERCAVEVESLGPQGPLKLVTDGFAIAIRNLVLD